MVFELQLLIAFALDLFIGDPRWFPHPVRLIGQLAVQVEQLMRKMIGNLYLGGAVSVLLIVGISSSLIWLFLTMTALISGLIADMVAVVLLYMAIAMKDLMVHSQEVYEQLETHKDIEQARIAVAKIVGRDTESLDEPGVVKACVESVAENMVDGIAAPVFWAIVATFFAPFCPMNEIGLAALGAMSYKAINTLDSMFGYRNEKYLKFGRLAARLDDLVNWPVARLSGISLIMASYCLGLGWKNTYKIYRRDRLNHLSPNAAHSEAAVAGALGIMLGGVSVYHGRQVVKPTIGEAKRGVRAADILLTNRLVLAGSFVFMLLMLVVRQLLLFFIHA